MIHFSDGAMRWLETILFERFGHHFTLAQQPNTLQFYLKGSQGSITFARLQSIFHQSRSDFPCQQWQASSEDFTAPIDDYIPAPSLTELPSPLIEFSKQGATIHYDILGLTYWALTRLEEVGRKDLDNHQRFPAVSSHAYQHGYLERPIIDEWLMILGLVIQRVWPDIELKQHEFSIQVSHDVDSPSMYGFKPWPTIGRMMAGHLLKRRDLKAFFTALYVKLATHRQLHPADPYNTFEWLMDISEANNIKSAFYFICGGNHSHDADYLPEHPAIRNLMRRIHERGHEIGLHPSYGTFQQPELIKQEAERLKRICAEESIEQQLWGGRMHYLRWEQPTTMRAWAGAGMTYDSTLGYADRPGFRCGTCYEYPAFDPVAQVQLNLRIRPLVVMECTVIDAVYLGLGVTEAAEEKIQQLKMRCQQVSGTFGLLWHNSYFKNSNLRNIYKNVLGSQL
ncbi:TPA: polysaccharide deacetylase family protein [Vibrio cholerae]|nr:polysaccharide deacetylase family protein [Vibrio cholerae]HDI3215264.1 polysaccharide deacetylase family protein [Vibrio cholerae]HDI3260938.1 polysaccharide deacetylase family protein [Vibrio cholerae]